MRRREERYDVCDVIRLDGCDEKFCPEHETDGVTQWNDGVYDGWLHVRGSCGSCDRFWTDVDVNTRFYAEPQS